MQFISIAILFLSTLAAVTADGLRGKRGLQPAQGGGGGLLGTCYRFHSPTFVDLSAKFWEFSLNASTTISSYAFRVDDDIVSSDPGYLVSWTLYGSLGSSDGTAPTSPSDPSWVFVDAQTDVDFSSPETDLFTPGLPFRSSEVFYYPLNSSVTFQYFGFVGSVTPPLNSTVTFADPIIAVKFCS